MSAEVLPSRFLIARAAGACAAEDTIGIIGGTIIRRPDIGRL
jgi:hypothetical protein